MNVWNFKVTGMSCGGCAASVKRAVASLDAAAQVDIDLGRGHVRVRTERQQAEIETKIRSRGYGVTAAHE
jgi:copper chaperone